VLVRDVSGYPLLERCLRVSIGRPEENNRFLEALDRALEKK
jgi:histidinol-phosphate aminotransferase